MSHKASEDKGEEEQAHKRYLNKKKKKKHFYRTKLSRFRELPLRAATMCTKLPLKDLPVKFE